MPAHIGVVVAVNRPRAETFGLPRQATVTLAAEESQLAVLSGGMRYVSRVVDATFPN